MSLLKSTSTKVISSPYTRRLQLSSLADHQSGDFTKVLVIGDAKSGKTGALASLVKAGYKLRILDYDNLLDPLAAFVRKECPDKINNVEFRSLRDKRKFGGAGESVIDGKPLAFSTGIRMFDNWKYDNVDLGRPGDWGPDCILVLDSLSRFCDAAFDFRLPLAVVGRSGEIDMRAVYGDAQDAVENALANLTSEHFHCNVIVIAHIVYQETPDGIKGFPQGVGQKLSPKIPQYFPTVIRFFNKGGNRTIKTTSTPMIDLANPKPFEMEKEYDISDGMAKIFAVLREPPKATTPKVVATGMRRVT